MSNPISPKTRGVLYLLGVIVGTLAVVVGPLIVALAIPDTWAAVIVSLIGAVTSLLSLLARDNLPPLETTNSADIVTNDHDYILDIGDLSADDDPTGPLTAGDDE